MDKSLNEKNLELFTKGMVVIKNRELGTTEKNATLFDGDVTLTVDAGFGTSDIGGIELIPGKSYEINVNGTISNFTCTIDADKGPVIGQLVQANDALIAEDGLLTVANPSSNTLHIKVTGEKRKLGTVDTLNGYNLVNGTGNGSLRQVTAQSAEGTWSDAFGVNTRARGNASFAEGRNTESSGTAAHAEGNGTTAIGAAAHAEGTGTKATASSAHAEGSATEATSANAHAEGISTLASAPASHAEGNNTKATAENAHAEGALTKASSANQHVQGRANVEDAANVYADIIGNGASDAARKNIEATTWTGDKRLKGDVYVHCNDDSTGGEKLVSSSVISNQYSTSTTYDKNNFCIYDGELYKCKEDGVNGEWNPAKWDKTIVSKEFGSGGGGGGAVDSVNGKTGTVILRAEDIAVVDAKGLYDATTTEGVLQELPDVYLPIQDPVAKGNFKIGGVKFVGTDPDYPPTNNISLGTAGTITDSNGIIFSAMTGTVTDSSYVLVTGTGVTTKTKPVINSVTNGALLGALKVDKSDSIVVAGNNTVNMSGNSVIAGVKNEVGVGTTGTMKTADIVAARNSKVEGNVTATFGAGQDNEGIQTLVCGSYNKAGVKAVSTVVEGACTESNSYAQHVQGRANVVDTPDSTGFGKFADIIGGGDVTVENNTEYKYDHTGKAAQTNTVAFTATTRKNIEATTWAGDKMLKGDAYIHCNDDSTGGISLLASTSIAPAFSTTATYTVGKYCIYKSELYKCTTAVTAAGAWNAANWTKTTVMEEIYALLNP